MRHTLLVCLLGISVAWAQELTLEQADARFRRANSLARESNDPKQMDRMKLIREQLLRTISRKDIAGSERLLRDAEKEVGIDPGGKTMYGLPLAQNDASLLKNLKNLEAPFQKAMQSGDLTTIKASLEEMTRALGENVGVPDARVKGEKEAVVPVTASDVARTFLQLLDLNPGQIKTFTSGQPAPQVMPRAYATVALACLEIRSQVQADAPERVKDLDTLIHGCCKSMQALQLESGLFKFPDLRGKHVRFGEMIEKLVEDNIEAVKEGWVVVPSPDGGSQFDAGECGIALLRASGVFKDDGYRKAGLQAAKWARDYPLFPNFNYNAFSVSLLCEAYRQTKDAAWLQAADRKYRIGIAPGQTANGRWIDPHNARTVYSLIILRALNDLIELQSAGNERFDISVSAQKLVASLSNEAERLGAPTMTYLIQELQRYCKDQPSDTAARKYLELAASVAYQKCTPKGRVRAAVPLTEFVAIRSVWAKK